MFRSKACTEVTRAVMWGLCLGVVGGGSDGCIKGAGGCPTLKCEHGHTVTDGTVEMRTASLVYIRGRRHIHKVTKYCMSNTGWELKPSPK